ncbi:MAG: FAD-dependent thymidylate synthase [Candidatus Aenigmatarchaeota archaeon]|nr:MAG: FAD-dependent thymidylate synthase [Candidatus Aenigmarchaeota archaeon]
MKVKLIAHTYDPEKIVGISAYTSISEKGPIAKMEEYDNEKGKKIIKNLVSYGHHSVIEHATFTFGVEGISRTCTHQLVRHRIASYTQQSQRYVKFTDLDYVTPPTIQRHEEAKKIFHETMKKTAEAYQKLIDIGIPPEDARFVFSNAAKSNIVITMNARELLHIFRLRCCLRAQWEIRELANRMLLEVKKTAPTIFENAGPNCVQLGYCPEGKLSCGKIQKIIETYKNLKGDSDEIKKLIALGED